MILIRLDDMIIVDTTEEKANINVQKKISRDIRKKEKNM